MRAVQEFIWVWRRISALRCCDYGWSQLRVAGVAVTRDSSIPGVECCHIADPFGNGVESILEWCGCWQPVP